MTEGPGAAELRPLQVEMNGINVIAESERKGHPRDLFWPWFAANASGLGLSYGAFVLGFGISFWQALTVGVAGIVLSFLACGFIAVAGKRGSAPTMVLSRAAFGVRGSKLPAVISWLLTVGWETVLVVLATLATATVFERLGWGGGDATKVVALVVVAALIVAGSSDRVSSALAADAVGGLAQILPTWFLVPFIIVAVLGLVGGAVLDIYSSGLALLSAGLRVPRYVAALIDGTVMVLGSIYV